MRTIARGALAVFTIAALATAPAEAGQLIVQRTPGPPLPVNFGTDFTYLGEAQARIGDNNANTVSNNRELGIHDAAANTPPKTEAGFSWGNGTLYEFSLSYGSDGKLTFNVGGTEISHNLGTLNSFQDIVIFASANTNAGIKSSTTTVKDLQLQTDGGPFVLNNSQFALDANRPSDPAESPQTLWLRAGDGVDYNEGFTLTGLLGFEWTGTFPNNSNTSLFNVGFKLGSAEGFDLEGGTAIEAIPEPSTVAMAAVAGVMFLGYGLRRRRSNRAK
jgi:hypothetical protein